MASPFAKLPDLFGAAVEVTSSDARTEATYRHRDIRERHGVVSP